MKFLKHYFPLMLQLFGTQIIISLLSNMLYGTLYDLPVLLIIGMTAALFVYFYLQYRSVWEFACRESIKNPDIQVHFGPLTGLFVGLGAGLPSFLLNLIPAIAPMHITETGDLSGGLSQLIYTLSKFFFNGQYIAIIQSFFPIQIISVQDSALAAQNAKNIIASLPYYPLTCIPLGLVTWFAFWLGLKDRTLSSLFGIDQNARKKRKAEKPVLKQK